ncbi:MULTISPECIES: response regulator transcription factor [Paenibacillus]|jgi:two-component system response regulator RegX3|uniref:response regulator transcription factor n=1 Tax=Paenibacillus TaxID=44249 RepID=UPI000D3185B6|nr:MULTISPECIES: response regulator transcription factor [Paenibacillus]KAF6614872.1 response regulator transcription factor [Paenibacillus sp. EKM101P]KAF6618067.1 response regulator transcription factor [Paenibacillus sp. EKM102P]KAF6626258.1 response regulator transcription factor [Paenibacillus sp. EKM10P]KAF6642714.1 response regulator transcription factor [Paenibacillus sp. EKM11P]MBY0025111.1 response regulator transcription factor [Paenibacillus polymyxa]
MSNVLIIEDDNMLGDTLSLYLTGEGYHVTRVEQATEGIARLDRVQPDIILLDLLLPDLDGVNPCPLIRKHTDVPIIVISTENDISERIRTLTLGADDYICKPFSMQELKARIEALFRRIKITRLQGRGISPVAEPETGITLDLARRMVTVNGQMVEMTYSEFELMKLFYTNRGIVFSRYALIQALRGTDSFINERAVDVHINHLRRKIEKDPKKPQLIKTIWGVGYKFMH